MTIYYQYIEDENLLLQKAVGDWSTDYYIKYVEEVFMNEKMKQVKKILTDFRNISLEKAFKDIDLLIELRNKMIHLDYLSVVIVNQKSTAVTHLYQSKVITKGFEHNYRSTMRGALEILNVNINENEMEELFKKIEHQK